MRKIRLKYLILGLILLFNTFILVVGCSEKNIDLKEAKFINVKPTIIIDDMEYIVTGEIIEKSKLDKAIAKIENIEEIISYTDADNPYKNLRLIYKIKNVDIDNSIAIEINENIYIAKK